MKYAVFTPQGVYVFEAEDEEDAREQYNDHYPLEVMYDIPKYQVEAIKPLTKEMEELYCDDWDYTDWSDETEEEKLVNEHPLPEKEYVVITKSGAEYIYSAPTLEQAVMKFNRTCIAPIDPMMGAFGYQRK